MFRTEHTTRTSTVLLVDMSRSMLLRGCFVAAKKVAIALNTLIRTEFPRDHLSVIGFAYYAREIRPETLAELSWHGYEYGTNLQHGLMLARRILAREHGGNREIVVITDGEPTAHFEDGQVEFSYPPTRRTIQETLREVVRCTKDGITINTFMLERVALAGRIRGARDAAQPRSGLLRRPRSTSASTSSSTSSRDGRARSASHLALGGRFTALRAARRPCRFPGRRLPLASSVVADARRGGNAPTCGRRGRDSTPPPAAILSFCRPETVIRLAPRPDRRIGADSCVGGSATARVEERSSG